MFTTYCSGNVCNKPLCPLDPELSCIPADCGGGIDDFLTILALFYSLITNCISFVHSSLPKPLSKITLARDRYLTNDFNNGLGSEL